MAAISTVAVGRLYVAGASHQHEAAIAALQTVLSLPWKEARVEAANAVAYTTRNHPEWFWRGAQHAEMACNRQGQPEQASSSSLIRHCRIKLGAGRRAQAIHAPVAALLILPVVIYSVLMIASVAVTVATISVHRSAQFWHSGSSSEE